MLEFPLYLTVAGWGVWRAAYDSHQSLSRLTFVALAVGYLWVVRSAGYDRDMEFYVYAMESSVWSADVLRYLKEPVYWLGAESLYRFIGNSMLTLLTIDVVWLGMLLVAVKNFRMHVYFLAVALVFFPFVAGYQNVYRQLLATVIFIYAWSQPRDTRLVGWWIVAMLTHNVIGLLAPVVVWRVLAQQGVNRWLRRICFTLSLLPVLLALAATGMDGTVLTKAEAATGLSLEWAYAALFIVLALLSVLLSRSVPAQALRDAPFIIYSMCVYPLIAFALGSAQAERVGMMFLTLCALELALLVERRFRGGQRAAVRVCFLLLCVLPTLAFPATRNFLLTAL